MNPRDLPEVVSGMIRKLHEVHSEQKGLKGSINRSTRRLDGIESTVKRMRTALKQNSRSSVGGATHGFKPCLNRLLKHDDHLRTYAGRLHHIENPQQ